MAKPTEKENFIAGVLGIVIIFVVVFLIAVVISIIHYPQAYKQADGDYFTSGIIFTDNVLKSEYKKTGEGINLECFGKYSTYKRINQDMNIVIHNITVCGTENLEGK